MNIERSFQLRRAHKDFKAAKEAYHADQAANEATTAQGMMNVRMSDYNRFRDISAQRHRLLENYCKGREEVEFLLGETPGEYDLYGTIRYYDDGEGGTTVLSWFEYQMGVVIESDQFRANFIPESVTLEKSDDEYPKVVVDEDLSHRILLPDQYPLEVATDGMFTGHSIVGPLHLWIPPLGAEPLLLTRPAMSEITRRLFTKP